jgi:N-acetylglucosamine kinase
MRYVVGIDAGGTKTIGLLADETGKVLAEARGSGANLQTGGELEVEKVFDDVLETLGRDHPISAVCLGIAGVDRPQDEQVIKGILRRLGHRQTDRTGVVVLAGTGSIAYGADRTGRTARAGGYGFLLADEGSGYWLGHQSLRAVVRAADGRGPATALTALLFEELEVASVPELVPRVYERGLPKHRIAALAPLVQRALDHGDAVARDLIAQGARELALIAVSVARQLTLGPEPYPVVLAGGVFKGCPALLEPLVAALDLPLARPVRLQVEPARGAVNLALDLLP